jgi:tRNA(fMet)-specific endonuclease VapC
MKVLLDTSAYSAFKRGDGAISDLLAQGEVIFVPVPVLGELRAGFRLGGKEERYLAELEEFLRRPRVRVHSCSDETAIFYAEIYARLRALGRPIPTNDLWIAAAALESGSILLSYDDHFHAVAGLVTRPVPAE